VLETNCVFPMKSLNILRFWSILVKEGKTCFYFHRTLAPKRSHQQKGSLVERSLSKI